MLAYGYVTAFILEVAIITKDVVKFFKTDIPLQYCQAMRDEGYLHYGTTVNECALFLGQYFIVFVFMGIAYTIPFKLWFSYICFKYSHQLVATEEGKLERRETVKAA